MEGGTIVRSNNNVRLITRLLVFVATLALIGADMIVSGQNSNSSTTQSDNTSMQNSNMRRSGGRRGGRRRAAAATTENANTAGATQENANTTGAAPSTRGRRGRRRRGPGPMTMDGVNRNDNTPVRTGRCDPNMQTQTDLSGTYTGKIGYSDAGLSGDATLTINGNDFTLTTTTGPTTAEGRIVAVTTCNYTAATMQFGKSAAATPGQPSPPPPPIFSLTVKRTGGGLILTPAPGEMKQFSFTSRGGGGKRMGGSRRGRRAAAATGATPSEAAQPTETPVTPRRGRGRRGGNLRPAGGNTNANANAPGESPSMLAPSEPTGIGRRRGRRRATNAKPSNNNSNQ